MIEPAFAGRARCFMAMRRCLQPDRVCAVFISRRVERGPKLEL